MQRVQACFEESYRRLVAQLFAVCGDLAEAEDVVAEAFAKAASRPDAFERVDNPEAWLRTVAVNLARSRHRRRRLGAAREVQRGPQLGARPELREEVLDLVAALRALPRKQREAVALHYLADLPVEEVARALGAPIGTVKARLSRGRVALAALLGEQGSEAQHVES